MKLWCHLISHSVGRGVGVQLKYSSSAGTTSQCPNGASYTVKLPAGHTVTMKGQYRLIAAAIFMVLNLAQSGNDQKTRSRKY